MSDSLPQFWLRWLKIPAPPAADSLALLPLHVAVVSATSSTAPVADIAVVQSEAVVHRDTAPRSKRQRTLLDEPGLASISILASDLSGGTQRSVASRKVDVPPVICQPNLPELVSVSAHDFLAWRAGHLVTRRTSSVWRTRCRRKGPAALDRVLLCLAADPDADASGCGAVGQSEGRSADNSATALFANAYSLTAREARKLWAPIWARAAASVRNNWVHLFETKGYDELRKNLTLPADLSEVDDVADGVCAGAFLTGTSGGQTGQVSGVLVSQRGHCSLGQGNMVP